MDWVETTGKTLDEAIAAAADSLGVAPHDLEVEVLEEPKSGLFGLIRGEARIRARLKPRLERRPSTRRRTAAQTRSTERQGQRSGRRVAQTRSGTSGRRPSPSRSQRARRPSTGVTRATRREPVSWNELGEEATEKVRAVGVRFLEGLAKAVGGQNVRVNAEGPGDEDILKFELEGDNLAQLVGPRGSVLSAVHELLKAAGRNEINREVGRVSLDIAGYRRKRTEALIEFAKKVAEDVKATGKPKALEPMTPGDRRVVHNAILEVEGVVTFSKGEDPHRYVVIAPAPSGGSEGDSGGSHNGNAG
jgi:spoIIIJ-associated protein